MNSDAANYLRMKTQPDPSDSELLQSMLAGEEEALAALYRRRQRGIYLFALQMCGSRSLAEDITQEVFMVLIRRKDYSLSEPKCTRRCFFALLRRRQMPKVVW